MGGATKTIKKVGTGLGFGPSGILGAYGVRDAVKLGTDYAKKELGLVAPTIAAVAAAPQMDDEQAQLARRRAIALQFARGGRNSTILSADSYGTDTLG